MAMVVVAVTLPPQPTTHYIFYNEPLMVFNIKSLVLPHNVASYLSP